MKGLGFRAYFRVEDFWKTAIVEIQEELLGLDGESVKKFSYLRRFLFRLFKKLRLYKFLHTLLPLQIFLVLLSKTCWLISEMVFSNRYMRRFLMGRVDEVEFSAVYNLHNSGGAIGPGNHDDFVRYSDVLMHMPEENPAGVWIANRKSIHEMKSQLKKVEYDGKNCKALISLLEKATRENLSSTDSFANLGDFSVGKSSSKMMVASLLTIIIELSAFYQDSGGSSAGPPTDTVNDSIEACCQAWQIMELLEKSESETVAVNKQADKIFHILKESRSWMGLALPINNFQPRTVEAAKSAVQGLADKVKQMANTGYESKNWKTLMAGNSLYKLCDSMKDYSVNAQELLNGIQSSLGDVIRSCIFKMGEIIVDECRLWAEAFMEDELWDALYEAGRAKGITQQLQPRIKVGRKLDKVHSF